MQAIRDAILSGDRTQETYANIAIPQTYRGATVHKDEVGMFEGLATQGQGPPQVAAHRRRAGARARAR